MRHMSLSLDFRRLHFLGLNRIKESFPSDGRLTLYLLILFYAIGISAGALFVRGCDPAVLSFASDISGDFFAAHNSGFAGAFIYSFLNFLKYLAAAFLTGLFIPGAIVAPAVMIIRGAEIGLISGLLYQNNALSGMLHNLVFMFPTSVASVMIIALAFRESIGFSGSLFMFAVRGKAVSLDSGFRLYCFRYLIILGLLLLCSLFDAGVSVLFAGRFLF